MASKGGKKWIQKAIKNPGALTEKAERKGMTIDQLCSRKNLDTRTKRQCNLARTLQEFVRRRKKGD
ncbi:MAG TPA: hypothetical protein PKZ07_19025 [Sedimentisphaerales bacterium]|nr:hypothetical protein [Sedimentisphaerales bacterium]